ncbi:SulP family inorganic anion transporter [Synechococcus sp. PCC 7336]
MQREWFANLKGDILAGMVVDLALIPEAIAFSMIAGVPAWFHLRWWRL